jgi:hypothetical protein
MVDEGRPDHHALPHRHPPIPRRQIVAQVIVGAVILVSGIAIGAGGTILALKDRIIPPFRERTSSGKTPGQDPNEGGRRSDWIAKRWQEDYGLSDEQARQVRETLAKEFQATDKLWADFRKAEETQRQKFALAMKGILTAEQFTKWEADFNRMVEHMRNMRPFDPRRGGRGGPPGERRPDWRPDRRMDPNDRRGDWPPDAPRDPNDRRWEGQRGRFMGPDGRRGGQPRDPNARRGDRPPERFMGPEGRPEGPPPMPPAEADGPR